jgi:hypothetical protein
MSRAMNVRSVAIELQHLLLRFGQRDPRRELGEQP